MCLMQARRLLHEHTDLPTRCPLCIATFVEGDERRLFPWVLANPGPKDAHMLAP